MMRDIYEIPAGMNLVGTCGVCGGPVLSPQLYSNSWTGASPPGSCGDCGRFAKQETIPRFGPIKEMLP